MFVIERRIAALFRAALRRCHDGPASRADQIPVLARLTKNGLFMHVRQESFAIMYHHPDVMGKGVFAFLASVLGLMEGRTDDPVEITLQRPDLAQARWTDRGAQHVVEIPLLEPGLVAVPPELPTEFTPLPLHFVPALYEASRTAAMQDTKYLISKVQLRGKSGTLVATDTRQLLVQGGFNFPFKEDVLIPRCEVFGLQPLQQYEDVAIGRTDMHVAIRVGPWTFVFPIDKEGRYPDATQIIPRSPRAATRLCLHPEDAQHFLNNLVRRLKGAAAKDHAITLDLTDGPCLRFEMEGSIVEVALPQSKVVGERVRMVLNLAQFLRALELRFLEFEIHDPDKPIVTRDGERIYMSMPMPAHAVLRSRSSADSVPVPEPSRALAPMPAVQAPAPESPQRPHPNPIDILGEAEGLKEGLFKVAAHAGQILRFLREVCTQQRVTQIFRTSLLSLLDRHSTGDRT